MTSSLTLRRWALYLSTLGMIRWLSDSVQPLLNEPRVVGVFTHGRS
jgi:hypothetical protein